MNESDITIFELDLINCEHFHKKKSKHNLQKKKKENIYICIKSKFNRRKKSNLI